MKTIWEETVLGNFNQASFTYNNEARVQKKIANQLAIECLKKTICPGLWLDLGTGTGLLADSLEELNPKQSILRIDVSKMMLAQHQQKSYVKLWDLNLGLPTDLPQPPNLIASSFSLHWLNDPKNRIKEWFSALAPGGWLALAVPIQGSFSEWHKAASLAKVNCTAMDLPSHHSLIESLNQNDIQYQHIESITQTASSVNSLLKPLVKMGAQATHHKPLRVTEWRRLKENWPVCEDNFEKQLTWIIQILLAQK